MAHKEMEDRILRVNFMSDVVLQSILRTQSYRLLERHGVARYWGLFKANGLLLAQDAPIGFSE